MIEQPQTGTKDNYNIDDVLIIGAGPAGLMTGYELSHKSELAVRILEANPVYVGGISRTQTFKGFHFDIGGHRFFSKSPEIEALWKQLLPDDLMIRQRLSHIYYGKKFYSYPLRAFEALYNLGAIESCLCVASYLRARILPIQTPHSFAQWVTNAFGHRLFTIFFKTYTEKVWGITTDELSADWAAQRIKGLSLSKAILTSLFKKAAAKSKIKTLSEAFYYPRLGPGMMWEAVATRIRSKGGEIETDRRVTGYSWDETQRLWTVTAEDSSGTKHLYQARQIVSSAPMREIVSSIQPPMKTAKLAENLRYRDFVTVALLLNKPAPFNDNWIYIHDPSVKVGRIQNFAAWSPDMVPMTQSGCLGLEYFCFEKDALWIASDESLITLAKDELAKLEIIDTACIYDGCVVRQPKAYPIYDGVYQGIVDSVKEELQTSFPSLHLIGRNGLHKYDNQDHAMMTGLLTARNIIAGKRLYDPWAVNEDAEYHEDRCK